MMPGVGFAEMVLLVLVGIVVIGPKDLPLMMRKFGRFTGKMRALAFEFKQGIDELGRQAELEELRKEVADLKKHTGLDDISRDLEQDRINLERDVSSALAPAAVSPPQLSPAPVLGPEARAADSHVHGDDNRIGGALEPAATAPSPVKQETPA